MDLTDGLTFLALEQAVEQRPAQAAAATTAAPGTARPWSKPPPGPGWWATQAGAQFASAVACE